MEYLLVFVGYLIGSIPFGLVFGRVVGVDVRAAGSGNIGATNVNRLLGKKIGILTLFADAGKAVLPMVIADLLLGGANSQMWVAATGGAVFLGHIYPLYLKFKGGKGVATALGVFFYIHPLALTLCVAVFAAVVWGSGYVSLGSLIASALMPGLIWLLHGPRHAVYLSLFIAALIWFKHLENIKRLLTHRENSFRQKMVGASSGRGEKQNV